MASLNLAELQPLRERLNEHPIYGAIETIEDLRIFMAHHVFSVWDFMSLVKYLQQQVAPTTVPWIPRGDPSLRRFLNELVLEEESDSLDMGETGTAFASHFESYCQAMNEIGADGEMPKRFLDRVANEGLDAALYSPMVPLPARYFTETTFAVIREDKPHEVAASLALGRESLIPEMFRRLLSSMQLTQKDAPAFHAYLQRHIHLDEDFHGPASIRLLEALCDGDPAKLEEAQTAAEEAICARIRLWDAVLEAIQSARQG